MAGPMGGGDDDAPFASINVVPLVDIILVVLIIFMVTAPMINRPSINVNLPKATSGDDSSETPLNVVISATGQVLLNGKAASE
jgi:biopolymer transport protein ExbD